MSRNMVQQTQMAKHLQQLIKTFDSALLQAESVKSPKYSAPWSRQLHAAVARLSLLENGICVGTIQHRFFTQSSSISQKNGTLTCLHQSITIQEAKIGLRDAQNALKSARSNGHLLRRQMLDEDQTEAIEIGDKAKANYALQDHQSGNNTRNISETVQCIGRYTTQSWTQFRLRMNKV